MRPAALPSNEPEDVLAWLREVGAPTLAGRMGIVFTEASAERVVARMPVEGNTQLQGMLHGGASLVLAESLGSIGAAMHAGRHRIAVGVDISATHHRAVRRGWVTGVATPLYLGQDLVTYEVIVTDDSDARVCSARITCAVRGSARRRPARPAP